MTQKILNLGRIFRVEPFFGVAAGLQIPNIAKKRFEEKCYSLVGIAASCIDSVFGEFCFCRGDINERNNRQNRHERKNSEQNDPEDFLFCIFGGRP
jgi:hypothetical protein